MKRIKKILVLIAITALAANFLISFGNVGHAFDWGSGHDWGEAIFGSDNSGALSFTEYEGGLAELSTEGYDTALTSSSDLKEFVLRVVNFALGFLGLIAVLMIIFAGVTYVTSAGQDEKTGNAKKMITYAAVGLIIVLGSFALVNTIVRSAVVGDTSTGGTGVFGKNYGKGFNAIAEETKGIAIDIYSGYVFLADTTEEFNNIMTDKNKDSLKIENLPSRAMINAFLYDTKSKLASMKAKVGSLTEVEAAINDKIRELETEIDKLNTLQITGLIKYEDGQIKDCDPNESGFWDEAEEMFTAEESCAFDGYVSNDAGKPFLEEWDEFKTNLDFNGTGQDKGIIKLLGENYGRDLEEYLDRLIEINDSVSSISAIKNGKAQEKYTIMLGESTPSNYAGKYGDLLESVKDWSSDADINGIAEDSLIPALQAHDKYYTELRNLQFVDARLHADVVKGNAPLTVIFDVGESTDPAGGSIDNGNVVWDPAGTQVVNGVISKLPTIKDDGTIDPSTIGTKGEIDTTKNANVILIKGDSDSVYCDSSEEVKNEIAETSKRCTFNKPGTYIATVIVNSNDQTKYGPGISTLKIVATPPTTKIELKGITASVPEGKYIMHYENEEAQDDPGNIDAKQLVVANTEVASLVFDASETDAVSYKWNFGNGNITDWSASYSKVEADQFGEYDLGSYQVTLEVMNKNGAIDKKIFNLVVKNISSSVSIESEFVDITALGLATEVESSIGEKIGNAVLVNTPIIFDGSKSTASKGNKIISYKWEVFQINDKNSAASGEALNQDEINQGPNRTTYQYSFQSAGWYEIHLTVQGSGIGTNNTDTSIQKIRVVSKPPKALFDYEIRESNQPSTLYLDNLSFDSDNKTEDLVHTWTITPPQADVEDKEGVKNWTILNGSTTGEEITDVKNPIIKFNEKGDYEIKLITKTVINEVEATGEVSEVTKEITIDNVLDVAWDTTQQKVASKINQDMTFYIVSENAVGYEVDFGDGETESGNEIPKEGIKHQYKQSGKYVVEATVFDAEDEDNSIKKKILIGGGESPVAYATVIINGAEITDNTEAIEVIKSDKLIFTGAKSINLDGTGRKLKYSWDFGDMYKSSLKESQHSYSELSPKDKGFYEVKLSVYDQSDSSKVSAPDTLQINVCPAAPKYSSLEATPQKKTTPLVTPAIINVRAYDTSDPDGGKITKYRWWYFDTANPEEELGMQITNDPMAQITIGANGEPGAEKEYGIGLEVTDTDGLKYCNTEACREIMTASYEQFPTCEKLQSLADKEYVENYPVIIVENEKNELPQAKFNIDKTQANTGEKVKFTSSSLDVDGKIKSYIWDFEGNGFYDNSPTEDSSVTHVYETKNPEGYKVKLKVVDDKGGEDVSEEIAVHITAKAKTPVAAFKSEVVPSSNGKKVAFTDKSVPDEEADVKLIKYSWDFDLDTDSDGDGSKTNDTDSDAVNPEHTFTKNGEYKIKLTVTDEQGNKDDVTNEIKIPLANPPKASFACEINNATITCHDTSKADEISEAEIESRIWDFDTMSILETADSNGDGKKDNDEDSNEKDPTYTYGSNGLYKIKLTVTDDQGNSAEVSKNIDIQVDGGSGTVDSNAPDTENSNTGTGGSTQSQSGGLNAGIAPEINLVVKISILDAKTEQITLAIPDENGIIYLNNPKDMVIFDFSGSSDSIAYYIIDKNIYYDTDGDGIKDNDKNHETRLKGVYQISFDPSFQTTTVKITAKDIYGNQKSTTQTIKFK